MPDPLNDSEEVLLRQIHPSFFQDGEPSSQSFIPTPKDGGKLSVDRSSLTNAKASFELFTGSGNASAAVFGLSVGEFGAEAINCFPDPIVGGEGEADNPAHAVADYTPHGTNQQKNKAKRLKLKALARGQLHPPPAETAQ